MPMISFDDGPYRFNYRIAGVAIRDGRLLLHRFPADAFWSLPGGRADAGETSEATLIREMREETGLTVTHARLIWIAENFFTYRDRTYHELGLFYAMELNTTGTAPFAGAEGHHTLEFRWFSPEEMDQVEVYPLFLRRAWQEPTQGIRHFVEQHIR
ncbi:MAG: NUDIX hydrolase [Bacteroidia bacterium]|nr:NUDIX hydrolase [Bacteroidia bacterium]